MQSISTKTPLQLDECYLTRLNVEWRGTPDAKEARIGPLDLSADYECALQPGSEHAYEMVLSVAGRERLEQAAESGFVFDAVIVGRYRIENAKAGAEARLARINGVSLLYSTLRGMLSSTTGNFHFGRVALPSLNPIALVDEIEAKRSPAAAVTASTDSTAPIETPAAPLEKRSDPVP